MMKASMSYCCICPIALKMFGGRPTVGGACVGFGVGGDVGFGWSVVADACVDCGLALVAGALAGAFEVVPVTMPCAATIAKTHTERKRTRLSEH